MFIVLLTQDEPCFPSRWLTPINLSPRQNLAINNVK